MELGSGLAGIAAGKKRRRERRTDRESEPSLGNYAKERDYLPQWKGGEIMVDSSKTSVCGFCLAQNDMEYNLFRL